MLTFPSLRNTMYADTDNALARLGAADKAGYKRPVTPLDPGKPPSVA